jgi:hypothetical protein
MFRLSILLKPTSVFPPPPSFSFTPSRYLHPTLLKNIRDPEAMLSDYLDDEQTIRLLIGRVRMASGQPLYKSDMNKEIRAFYEAPIRVQFMGDLRRLTDSQINALTLPPWLKSGLIRLARNPPPATSSSSNTTTSSTTNTTNTTSQNIVQEANS